MEIISDEFLSFFEWLGPALVTFLKVVPGVIFVGLFGAFLITSIRHGPFEAFFKVAGSVATAVTKDFPHTSMRRIGAVARLAFQEAIRRRVLIAFAVFALLLLFAGWFLDTATDNPARVYLSFVLTTTKFLVLMLALFLSTFSLPSDIKNRTIHTVVTKPVRAGEIVFGRILGFATVGTLLVVVMCGVSLVFVLRGLDHDHQITEPFEAVAEEDRTVEHHSTGRTTADSNHRHRVEVDAEGNGRASAAAGHRHAVTKKGADSYEVSKPREMLQARVPIYGELRFLDREGNPTDKGISVGKEWGYRQFIEGLTLHTAIWTFEDVSEKRFPEGELRLALNLSVFRTHLGDIEKPVRGIIILNNPDPAKNLQTEPISFDSSEFAEKVITISRKQNRFGTGTSAAGEIDLFDDLTHDGRLEVWIRCDDRAQYFGMARADVYIRAPDASFVLNFIKGYIGIWLQMLMVVCLGVTFSTFLNAPVAMLATISTLVIGLFKGFIESIWTGEMVGGGPVEASIRVFKQENMVSTLDLHPVILTIIKWADFFLVSLIYIVANILPSFDRLGRLTEHVAYNYNVSGGLLARHCLVTLLYVVALSTIGYFLLRSREIAA